MYGVSVTYASAIVAGVLTAAALAAWPWARSRRRCPDNPGELGRRWQRRGYSLCNRCGLRVGYGAPRARDPRGRRRVHRGISCDDTGRLRLVRFCRERFSATTGHTQHVIHPRPWRREDFSDVRPPWEWVGRPSWLWASTR